MRSRFLIPRQLAIRAQNAHVSKKANAMSMADPSASTYAKAFSGVSPCKFRHVAALLLQCACCATAKGNRSDAWRRSDEQKAGNEYKRRVNQLVYLSIPPNDDRRTEGIKVVIK